MCLEMSQGSADWSRIVEKSAYRFDVTISGVTRTNTENKEKTIIYSSSEDKTNKKIYNTAKALAYIMSKKKTGIHTQDEAQIALWKFTFLLSNSYDNIRSFFHLPKNEMCDNGHNEVYDNALEIFNGKNVNDKVVEGTFCSMKYADISSDKDAQIMLFGFNFKEKETNVPIKLNFNKTNFNGTSLNDRGPKIKVTKGKNVKEIKTTTKEKDCCLSINVTPNDNTKPFEIILEEETPPNGYSKFNDKITLTVKYDSSKGTVKEVTSNNTFYVPNTKSNTIIVKNAPSTISINFLKQNFSNQLKSGAKIIVTKGENVKEISNLNNDGTLKAKNEAGKYEEIKVKPSDYGKRKFYNKVNRKRSTRGMCSISKRNYINSRV